MPTSKMLFLVEGLEAVCILLLAYYLFKLYTQMGTLTQTANEEAI